MDADLDTLVTALYVQVDDLLKANPDRAPRRPLVGITPRISDAELVTLAVAQALLGFTSEARWLRFSRTHLRGLFPYLPGQPGYNKRLRKLAGTLSWLIRALGTRTSMYSDDVWIADSTPVECGRSRETAKRSDLAGFAEYGFCASHTRYFWGLRLHLLCTLHGLPVGFAVTGAKADSFQTFTARPLVLTEREEPGVLVWHARTAASVLGPKIPSTVTGWFPARSRYCRAFCSLGIASFHFCCCNCCAAGSIEAEAASISFWKSLMACTSLVSSRACKRPESVTA